MDVFKLIRRLWLNKYAINIQTIDKLITLSILKNKKLKKRFQGYNRGYLLKQAEQYLG